MALPSSFNVLNRPCYNPIARKRTKCQSATKTAETASSVFTTTQKKRKFEEDEIKQVKKEAFSTCGAAADLSVKVPPLKKKRCELNETSAHLSSFMAELRQIGNQEAGEAMKKSLKSAREHLGVNAPQCAKLARETAKNLNQAEIMALAEDLWKTNLFEAMICSAKLLELPKVKPSKELWNFILRSLKDLDNWTIEDQLAKTAQKCILEDESRLDEIEKWTEDENFWIRRAALVYTLPFAKPDHKSERMLAWAAKYASDEEPFIQKAIGWWLRVLGSHNPEAVFCFLQKHGYKLQKIAKKEATRKLSFEWQEKINALGI